MNIFRWHKNSEELHTGMSICSDYSCKVNKSITYIINISNVQAVSLKICTLQYMYNVYLFSILYLLLTVWKPLHNLSQTNRIVQRF